MRRILRLQNCERVGREYPSALVSEKRGMESFDKKGKHKKFSINSNVFESSRGGIIEIRHILFIGNKKWSTSEECRESNRSELWPICSVRSISLDPTTTKSDQSTDLKTFHRHHFLWQTFSMQEKKGSISTNPTSRLQQQVFHSISLYSFILLHFTMEGLCLNSEPPAILPRTLSNKPLFLLFYFLIPPSFCNRFCLLLLLLLLLLQMHARWV